MPFKKRKTPPSETSKTGSEKTPTPPATAVGQDPSRSRAELILAFLILVAAIVSGWMSYGGAKAIFGDSMTALGFTIVVQGVVSVALWYFAVARGLQRVLLAAAWLIAVTFSVLTAFVHTDGENDGSKVTTAIVELSDYEAAVRAKIQETLRAAEAWEERIDAEAADGGCGSKCRQLQEQAAATLADAKFYTETVLPALDRAAADRTALVNPGLEDVLGIYQAIKNDIGALADDVPAPHFIDNTALGVFDRLANAYEGVFGSQGDLSVETLGALWVACLMELLALTCAMIRMSDKMRPSERSLGQRAEDALAWGYDLRTLPGRIKQLAKARFEKWMATHAPKPTPSKTSGSKPSVSAPQTMKTEQEFWLEGLHMQAKASEMDLAGLVLRLVEDSDPTFAADAKVFDKNKAIRTVLINTGVLTSSKNGLAPSAEKWKDWVNFLCEENRRLRTQKPANGATNLRSVA